MSSLVIFDLDGTLIDSSDGVVTAVNYALEKLGQPALPTDQIKATIGFPLTKAFAPYPNLDYAAAYALFQEKAVESVAASAVPLPRAEETLAALRESGWQLGLATTKIRVHVDAIMEKLGWRELFDATVSGDEVSRVKPAPDILRAVINKVSAPGRLAIAVGDTVNDLLAARAVPMPVVMVPCPYGGAEEVQALAPDHAITSLSELPQLLETMMRQHQYQSA